jgi:hypothetical protein
MIFYPLIQLLIAIMATAGLILISDHSLLPRMVLFVMTTPSTTLLTTTSDQDMISPARPSMPLLPRESNTTQPPQPQAEIKFTSALRELAKSSKLTKIYAQTQPPKLMPRH